MLLVAGRALGAPLAWAAVSLLPQLAPSLLPRLGDVRVDTTVVAGATLVAAMITILFGVLPPARQPSAASVARRLWTSEAAGIANRLSRRRSRWPRCCSSRRGCYAG